MVGCRKCQPFADHRPRMGTDLAAVKDWCAEASIKGKEAAKRIVSVSFTSILLFLVKKDRFHRRR